MSARAERFDAMREYTRQPNMFVSKQICYHVRQAGTAPRVRRECHAEKRRKHKDARRRASTVCSSENGATRPARHGMNEP